MRRLVPDPKTFGAQGKEICRNAFKNVKITGILVKITDFVKIWRSLLSGQAHRLADLNDPYLHVIPFSQKYPKTFEFGTSIAGGMREQEGLIHVSTKKERRSLQPRKEVFKVRRGRAVHNPFS
jgi:hypothetical protein